MARSVSVRYSPVRPCMRYRIGTFVRPWDDVVRWPGSLGHHDPGEAQEWPRAAVPGSAGSWLRNSCPMASLNSATLILPSASASSRSNAAWIMRSSTPWGERAGVLARLGEPATVLIHDPGEPPPVPGRTWVLGRLVTAPRPSAGKHSQRDRLSAERTAFHLGGVGIVFRKLGTWPS